MHNPIYSEIKGDYSIPRIAEVDVINPKLKPLVDLIQIPYKFFGKRCGNKNEILMDIASGEAYHKPIIDPLFKEIKFYDLFFQNEFIKKGDVRNIPEDNYFPVDYVDNHKKLSFISYKYFKDYINICQSIANSEYFSSLNHDSYKIYELDVWKGTGGLDWHWDGSKFELHQANFFVMIYFTNEISWEENQGGVIEFGRVIDPINIEDVNDPHKASYFYSRTKIVPTSSIPPNNKTMLIGINTDPNWVHRVSPQKSDKARIALYFTF